MKTTKRKVEEKCNNGMTSDISFGPRFTAREHLLGCQTLTQERHQCGNDYLFADTINLWIRNMCIIIVNINIMIIVTAHSHDISQ